MLQRYVNVGADVLVRGDGVEQSTGDFVRIGIEKPNPAELLNSGERVQQQRKAILQAKVLAVAGRVLADERNLLHPRSRQPLGFRNHGFKPSRAKLPPQLWNDAKTARMIAAFCDFDVRRRSWDRQYPRRGLVVKVIGQIGDRP